MIADTSALVAILRREPEASRFIDALLTADRVRISAATLLEARMVANRDNGIAELDELLETIDAEVIPVDQIQTDIAFDGLLGFGKGRHPAGLNYGDCFSYAAMAFNEALLFKGDDFSQTDVSAAV